MAAIRKQYDHADIVLTALGGQPTNFAGISYGDETEMQLNYGRGTEPIGYSTGKKVYEDTVISLGMEEVRGMESAANGDLSKLKPFDVFVTYLNEDFGEVTDKITVKPKGKKTASKSGDMNLTHDITCLTLGIIYGYL